ncbi:MAG: serine/threonine protein kinase, partial [Planctomycetia bacterium]|nr:serine/threonine protein kinase [Planctomycetia bacterium]
MSDPTSSQTQAATPDQVRRSATLSTLGPHAPSVGERYRIESILAKGGMGEVYKAHDLALNRDVAIKVLLGEPKNFELANRRFLHEASIGAQLQHPNIPPVYDIGSYSDGRPFLAMKLVKGRTLNELLKERADLAAERGRFVAIFEAIAQAIGYAHSRGVIHRDLKPSNVMVGAFGEVQVMDWGLAKFQSDTTELTPQESVASTFHDPRAGDDSRTSAGSIIGTPAYMPPEQAIGAVDKVTERSDVFGLGALLCSILTGQPPYVASDPEATRQLAAQGKLADAFARLDASGAEPELVALAKRCLNPDAAERPANGSEVAAAVARFRADAEARARQAEVARAASDTRRRVLAGSAAVVIAVLAGGIAVSWWQADRAKLAESKAIDEARDANAARDEAREQERLAENAVNFVRDIFSLANPHKQIGKVSTRELTVADVNARQRIDAQNHEKFSMSGMTIAAALKFAEQTIDVRFMDQPKAE